MGQGNVFTGVCLSTGAGVGFAACVTGHTTSIRWGGGGGSWLPSMHHRSHDQHLGCVHPEGLRLGCLPTGELGGGLHPGGSTYSGVGQTPLPELEKQAVHILLECFLVLSIEIIAG